MLQSIISVATDLPASCRRLWRAEDVRQSLSCSHRWSVLGWARGGPLKPGKTNRSPPRWKAKLDRIMVEITVLIRHGAAWKKPWSRTNFYFFYYLGPLPTLIPFKSLVSPSYTACPVCSYPSGSAFAVLIPLCWYLLYGFLDNPPLRSVNSPFYYLQDLSISHTVILLLQP